MISRNGETGTKRRGRPRKRPLQGPRLKRALRACLERLAQQPARTEPINVARVARIIGVSRTAIYKNGLDEMVEQYRQIQFENIPAEAPGRKPDRSVGRASSVSPAEESAMRQRLDELVQWWVYWARHAARHGVDPDLMFPNGGPGDPDWPVPPAPEMPVPDHGPQYKRRGRRKRTD